MTKRMIIILLAFGLVIGFSAPAVFAAEQPNQSKSEGKVTTGIFLTLRSGPCTKDRAAIYYGGNSYHR